MSTDFASRAQRRRRALKALDDPSHYEDLVNGFGSTLVVVRRPWPVARNRPGDWRKIVILPGSSLSGRLI
jgi:hypothetical protein